MGPCNPGIMRLMPWTKDFNPYLVKHTTSQCWVRMYGISREYWRPKIFFSIAHAVGTLLPWMTPLELEVLVNLLGFLWMLTCLKTSTIGSYWNDLTLHLMLIWWLKNCLPFAPSASLYWPYSR